MLIVSAILAVVVLLVIGVPFWVCLGLGTAVLLYTTGIMPLTLIGEALFDGVNSFALIAIPLFVLTGDVMVRSGLAYRLLDFAEASFGSFRSGFGTATVM
jgi:TRAP-type mannitol/chloroaromatic compound transport system permease large subunit